MASKKIPENKSSAGKRMGTMKEHRGFWMRHLILKQKKRREANQQEE